MQISTHIASNIVGERFTPVRYKEKIISNRHVQVGLYHLLGFIARAAAQVRAARHRLTAAQPFCSLSSLGTSYFHCAPDYQLKDRKGDASSCPIVYDAYMSIKRL